MKRRFLSLFAILSLVLMLLLTRLRLDVQPVKAQALKINIRYDGSIYPPTAPISTSDNVTYSFLSDINGSVSAGRSDVVIDGNGYTLQGDGAGDGFFVPSPVSNVTIENTNIINFSRGINLAGCRNITVSENNITANREAGVESTYWNPGMSQSDVILGNNITLNGVGVYILYWYPGMRFSNDRISQNNIEENDVAGVKIGRGIGESVVDNNIANNGMGIHLFLSTSSSTISGNYIADNNQCGILFENSANNAVVENTLTNNAQNLNLTGSSYNRLYHNNLVGSSVSTQVSSSQSVNVWDNGYPSGGNYWSDYNGSDVNSGPYQNETGYDWIGDSPYVIDQNNKDGYPLMRLFAPETEEIRIAYRTLLTDYYNLLANLNELDYSYQQTLQNYSDLQKNYYTLRTNQTLLTTDYATLTSAYSDLQAEFFALNLTHIQDYGDLLNKFQTLNSSFNDLNASYNDLNASYNEYRTSSQDELGYTRDFAYALTITTAILIVAVAYLAARKPKPKPEK